jgi:S1-C subfamily serine protease
MPAKAEEVIFSAKMKGMEDMNDNQILELIEKYINGEMSRVEKAKFEILRQENADIEARVNEHRQFLTILKQYSDRIELEQRLNAIHSEIDVDSLKESFAEHPSRIVQIWRDHHSKISVAATLLLFALMSVLYFAGSFNNHESYVDLVNKIDKQKKDINGLKNSVNAIKQHTPAMDNARGSGTGFAITSDGLIATNFHVVNNADSVYVQNADSVYKAEVLYSDPANDIAILKIVSSNFKGLGAIPYSFKRIESDLAENVSTFGYPSGKPVYHSGVINAASGLNGDSTHYQVSIPINYGNSGGPLFDSKGNVIGITDAKQSRAEGEHFAIKVRYLLNAVHNIPADSLSQKVILNKKSTLAGLSEEQKLKREKNFVFMVKVY